VRDGRFSTQVFERYQRSEKAPVGALAEMYVQGVSTRKVKAITEELSGHAFSASAISEINKTMDAELAACFDQRLEEAYPYLILDARYERVREAGVIRSRAVLVAIGIDWEDWRNVLDADDANLVHGCPLLLWRFSITSLAHCDAVGRGHPLHHGRPTFGHAQRATQTLPFP
jgi:putative transposase